MFTYTSRIFFLLRYKADNDYIFTVLGKDKDTTDIFE